MERGQRIIGEVTWPDGRVTMVEGDFICERNGEVYFESPLGPVVAPLDTIEIIEQPTNGDGKAMRTRTVNRRRA